MGDIGLKEAGVANAVQFPVLSVNGFTNSASAGIVFFPLKPFDERKDKSMSAGAIARTLQMKFAAIPEAFGCHISTAPVRGLGPLAGLNCK